MPGTPEADSPETEVRSAEPTVQAAAPGTPGSSTSGNSDTLTLPLVSLTSGVILPGMVFTLTLETEEARAAVEAAPTSGGRLVLVPRIEGRYSPVGVISEIVETGELPGGSLAAVVRGVERATIGTAVPGTGSALWIQVDPVARSEASEQALALAVHAGAPRLRRQLERGAQIGKARAARADRLERLHGKSDRAAQESGIAAAGRGGACTVAGSAIPTS